MGSEERLGPSAAPPTPIEGTVWLWPSLAFSLLLGRMLKLNDPTGLPAPQAHD